MAGSSAAFASWGGRTPTGRSIGRVGLVIVDSKGVIGFTVKSFDSDSGRAYSGERIRLE